MTRHAFLDESARGRTYLICASSISPANLSVARRELRSLRAPGQRRIHFATESDQRRRRLLKEISILDTVSVIYVTNHRDQVTARAALLTTAAIGLHGAGVSRVVIEAREGQDHRDRTVMYQALGPDPSPHLSYTHSGPATEPMLWVPDAVAWAWGRGGLWRRRVEDLGLVGAVERVLVP